MSEETQAGPLLELEAVTKHFRQGSHIVRVLRGVDLSIAPGEVVALVGESGSGKSTVARTIMRLYRPDSGDLRFRGNSVAHVEGPELTRYRHAVQMLFQDPFASLNPAHTVRTILWRSLPPELKQRRREAAARMEDALTQVGLTPPDNFLSKYPHELSGGQRQRVAFARALGLRPRLVLADEPVSMLDVSLRLGILNLMRNLNASQQLAYLYITHDLAGARYVATRILVMYAGEIVEEGPEATIVDAPKHPYTQLLVAAAPDPDRRGERQDQSVFQGEPPNLGLDIVGCPFQFRCPHVHERCRTTHPAMTHLADGQSVRCHLYSA